MNAWNTTAAMLLLISAPAWADSTAGALRELGGLGSGVVKNIDAPDQYTPRYTDSPEFADSYYGGGLTIPTNYGQDKINRCKTEAAQRDLYLRQECEGINFIVNNKTIRPDVTISANEKLVTGTQSIASDPKDTLDRFKWTYPLNADGSVGNIPQTACPTETITVPKVVREHSCNEYTGADMHLCEALLKVSVDPNFNYTCLESKYQNQKVECRKKLNVVCEQQVECANSGVKVGSAEGDMNLSIERVQGSEYRLTFGTKGDRYWWDHENNGIYDRKLTLDIQSFQKINKFELEKVFYDDWLAIEVNGHIVYSDFDGGKMLTVTWHQGNKLVREEGGRYLGPTERGQTWTYLPNKDLRPYLKEGKNVIRTRVIVGNGGHGAVFFKFNQYCEPVCHEKWDNQCLEYEKRVQK